MSRSLSCSASSLRRSSSSFFSSSPKRESSSASTQVSLLLLIAAAEGEGRRELFELLAHAHAPPHTHTHPHANPQPQAHPLTEFSFWFSAEYRLNTGAGSTSNQPARLLTLSVPIRSRPVNRPPPRPPTFAGVGVITIFPRSGSRTLPAQSSSSNPSSSGRTNSYSLMLLQHLLQTLHLVCLLTTLSHYPFRSLSSLLLQPGQLLLVSIHSVLVLTTASGSSTSPTHYMLPVMVPAISFRMRLLSLQFLEQVRYFVLQLDVLALISGKLVLLWVWSLALLLLRRLLLEASGNLLHIIKDIIPCSRSKPYEFEYNILITCCT